ncbi:MAG TPA: hypothetical protein VES79_04850 [Solirubrobacteraceae bacterium]|nr:hypothetical protein [Solirubrobacteraceae bacterium]
MTRTSLGILAFTALGLPAGVLAQQPEPVPAPVVPELHRTVVVERVSGRVLLKQPSQDSFVTLRGRREVPLGRREVPLGTTVKATEGRVRLIVARNRRGATFRAEFFRGQFVVMDSTGSPPLTTLVLAGSSYRKVCGEARASSRTDGRRVRRLWGDGKGRFRTRGRYSAATVRGTRWLTEDRCDGTLTRVSRGVVEVEDFTVVPNAPPVSGEDEGGAPAPPKPQRTPANAPRMIRVGSGESYVARPGG